jgi:hypothetical protein
MSERNFIHLHGSLLSPKPILKKGNGERREVLTYEFHSKLTYDDVMNAVGTTAEAGVQSDSFGWPV